MVRKVQSIHKEQYKKFGKEKPNVNKICHRNTVKVQVAKQKELLAALKSDSGLFSRLHISSHTRDRNLDEFFSHENHAALPTISVKWTQSETSDESRYSTLSKTKPA